MYSAQLKKSPWSKTVSALLLCPKYLLRCKAVSLLWPPGQWKGNCVFATYNGIKYTSPFLKGEVRNSEEILNQNKTKTEQAKQQILYLHIRSLSGALDLRVLKPPALLCAICFSLIGWIHALYQALLSSCLPALATPTSVIRSSFPQPHTRVSHRTGCLASEALRNCKGRLYDPLVCSCSHYPRASTMLKTLLSSAASWTWMLTSPSNTFSLFFF